MSREAAIITLYGDFNIGNKLQNYAVKKVLEEKGWHCTTLAYQELPYPDLNWKRKLMMRIGIPVQKARMFRRTDRRRKVFRRFSEKYLQPIRPVRFSQVVASDAHFSDEYDLFVCGSDQVWYGWSGLEEELDYFLLTFVEPQKKICLSPSFGRAEIAERERDRYRVGLMGFKRLSCREQRGCEMIRELTGREAQRLIDPTMALDTGQWEEIVRRPVGLIEDKPYGLVYILGEKTIEVRNFINAAVHRYGVDQIDIYNPDEECYYDYGPSEFIDLISHARWMITDSFHGCVFSLLFHCPFVCVERESRELENMSSRMDSLFELFGYEDRRLSRMNVESMMNISFESFDRLLEKERGQFRRYLDAALADLGVQ